MESLAELLVLSDLTNNIKSIKTYIENVKRHSNEMKAFLPIFNNTASLPIISSKYNGSIAYIDWILRSDVLYLCLNVIYFSTGRFKCALALSQQLTLVELTDRWNITTLSGKKFKQYHMRDNLLETYSVVTDRIISPRPFAIIENGLEAFKCRDKILKRYIGDLSI